MENLKRLSISRKLDPSERFFWMLDKVSGMNFVVFAEIDDKINVDHLRAALAQAQHAYPLLRVAIEQPSQYELRFAPSEAPLELRQIEVSQHDWQQPIERQLAQPFQLSDAPLMRAHYLQFTDQTRSVLALTFHHSIADGRSGATLLREILHCVAEPFGSHFQAGVAHPPLHDVFPPQYDWQKNPDAATDLALLKKAEIKRYGRSAALPWLDQQQTQRVPRFKRIELDTDATTSLIARCKQHGVTVHGALSAAQLLAMYQSTAESGPLTLSLASPADMRPYLSPVIPTGSLGLYVTILGSTYQVNGMPSFWDVAREVGVDIKRQLARGDGHLMYESIKPDAFPLDADGINEFARMMLKTPQASMISNIGIVEQVADASHVESISFVLSPMPYQIVFSAISTYGGKLVINMAYDAAKLSAQNATQFAQWIEQALHAACEEAIS